MAIAAKLLLVLFGELFYTGAAISESSTKVKKTAAKTKKLNRKNCHK